MNVLGLHGHNLTSIMGKFNFARNELWNLYLSKCEHVEEREKAAKAPRFPGDCPEKVNPTCSSDSSDKHNAAPEPCHECARCVR